MNLEEELNILNNDSTIMTSQTNQTNQINLNNAITEDNQAVTAELAQPITAQQTMVNPTQAQQQTNEFVFRDFSVDPNKPVYSRNPLERLSGDKGEVFRIHFLPKADTKEISVHWDADKGHNFVCLKEVYSTLAEPCCATHGDAKRRFIIPVIVMPINGNQPNNLAQGQPGKLACLILGPSQFNTLQEQANFAQLSLTQCDIIAAVDNPQYKSFNFTVTPTSFIQQIPNVEALINEWNTNATPENLLKSVGRLITRNEYNTNYANYDKAKYDNIQQNQGNYGQLNNQQTFNQGYNQPQSYAQSYGQTSTVYNQQDFNNQFNQNFGQPQGSENPWM